MEKTPSARTLALMNQKGGVGKTTTAVNLAAGLARLGQRTLLIDLDPQAHASLHLGIEPDENQPSVYDVLMDPSLDPSTAIRTSGERLDVLAAETDLAAAESELSPLADRTSRLGTAISKLSHRYDAVLIDCPPSLGLLTINALACAHQVLIPMQAHFLALHGVGKLLETVKMLSGSVNPELRVMGIVLCAYDAQASHTREVVADLDDFLSSATGTGEPWDGARVLQPAIRRNIKLAECPSFGQTIFEYAPGAPGAEDYEGLARSVRDRLASTHTRRATDPIEAEIHIKPHAQPAEHLP